MAASPLAATITQRAIKALEVADLTSGAIEAAMAAKDEERLAKLNQQREQRRSRN